MGEGLARRPARRRPSARRARCAPDSAPRGPPRRADPKQVAAARERTRRGAVSRRDRARARARAGARGHVAVEAHRGAGRIGHQRERAVAAQEGRVPPRSWARSSASERAASASAAGALGLDELVAVVIGERGVGLGQRRDRGSARRGRPRSTRPRAARPRARGARPRPRAPSRALVLDRIEGRAPGERAPRLARMPRRASRSAAICALVARAWASAASACSRRRAPSSQATTSAAERRRRPRTATRPRSLGERAQAGIAAPAPRHVGQSRRALAGHRCRRAARGGRR